jgi:hypothetical protein
MVGVEEVGAQGDALPESGSLLSAQRFAESFLSGAWQSSTLGNDCVYGEQDSRHRKTLGESRRSAKGRQQPSIADGRYLCRVSFMDTRQSIFYFFSFPNQTLSGMFLHYVDLHVPFCIIIEVFSITIRFSSFN